MVMMKALSTLTISLEVSLTELKDPPTEDALSKTKREGSTLLALIVSVKFSTSSADVKLRVKEVKTGLTPSRSSADARRALPFVIAVSYTHLTLPTIYSV